MPRLFNFLKKPPLDPATQIDPRQTPVPDLLREYEQLFRELIAHAGVKDSGVEVTSRHVGYTPDEDLPIFIVSVRMVAWDAQASPRLLLGLPLLQRAAQKALRHSWLGEASYFGGLWLHASSTLEIPHAESSFLREALAGWAPPSIATAEAA